MFRDCVSSARARKRWSKFLMEQTNNNKKERFEEGRMNANFVLTFERNLPEKNIFLCLFVNLFCCLFCEKICFIVMPSFFMGLPMNVDVDHHEVPLHRIYLARLKVRI